MKYFSSLEHGESLHPRLSMSANHCISHVAKRESWNTTIDEQVYRWLQIRQQKSWYCTKTVAGTGFTLQHLYTICNSVISGPLGPGTSRFWSWIDRFGPLIPYLVFNSATDRVTFLGKNPKKDWNEKGMRNIKKGHVIWMSGSKKTFIVKLSLPVASSSPKTSSNSIESPIRLILRKIYFRKNGYY